MRELTVACRIRQKTDRKKPHRRHEHRLEDDTKMNLKEIIFEGVDGILLAQNVGQWETPCEHGNEPSDSINDQSTERLSDS
jgi:hypothetical protein